MIVNLDEIVVNVRDRVEEDGVVRVMVEGADVEAGNDDKRKLIFENSIH